MRFVPPRRPRPSPPGALEPFRIAVLFCSALAAAAATQPWLAVAYPRLWNSAIEIRGWETAPGFSCLAGSVFAALLSLLETRSPRSLRAVMPGALLASAIAALSVGYGWWRGPGEIGILTAAFTPWFGIAMGGSWTAALAAAARAAAKRRRDRSSR